MSVWTLTLAFRHDSAAVLGVDNPVVVFERVHDLQDCAHPPNGVVDGDCAYELCCQVRVQRQLHLYRETTAGNVAFTNVLKYKRDKCEYESDLGRRVDPNGGVEQDVVAELFEQHDAVLQVAEVSGKGQYNVQDRPRHMNLGGLRQRVRNKGRWCQRMPGEKAKAERQQRRMRSNFFDS